MSIADVLAAIHAARFKRDSALVIVDFMIRHGMVTAESESNYLEIRCRLARRLSVAVPAS
jgi:hypothetical protein